MKTTELVQHPDNLALAYQQSLDGETSCIYIGCNNKSRLKSWGEWIYRQDWGLTRQETYAIRPSAHLKFKYELKLSALPSLVLGILARHNYSKQPTMPPEKLPLIPKIEPKFKLGSHITCSSAPDEVFQVRSEIIAEASQAKPIVPNTTAAPKEATSELENWEPGEESTLTSLEKPSLEPLVPLSATPSSSITAEDLAQWLRNSGSREEIEAVVAANEQHKRAAWKLLSPEEQNQLLVLKLQAKQGETQEELSLMGMER